MNLEDLTAEQLMELARLKGAEPQTTRASATVGVIEDDTRFETVDGVRFKVRPSMLKTWRAVKMATALQGGEVSMDKMIAMMNLVVLATDLTEERILEHCGGQDAEFTVVMMFLADVASVVFPKN